MLRVALLLAAGLLAGCTAASPGWVCPPAEVSAVSIGITVRGGGRPALTIERSPGAAVHTGMRY